MPLNHFHSSASQILADFGAHLLQFKHASNRLVYFRLSPTYFPVHPLKAIFKSENGECGNGNGNGNGEWGTGNGESLKWGIFKSGNL